MSPTIRRIRGDEGRALEACRLAALKESPFAFGSTYAAEADRPDGEWTARARAGAAGVDRATFFALLEDEIVGLGGGFRPEAEQFVVERRVSAASFGSVTHRSLHDSGSTHVRSKRVE
jgi:hypothetical protein